MKGGMFLLAVLIAACGPAPVVVSEPPIAFTDPLYVFVPAEPAEGELGGAQDIVTYLKRAADLDVTLVRGEAAGSVPDAAPRIHVGNTATAKRIIGDMLDGEELPDAFALRVRGNTLAIVGRMDLSTRWGCEEFLERCAGVRWYMPHSFGIHVPRLESIEVPAFDEVQRPSFMFRVGSNLSDPRARQHESLTGHSDHTFPQIFPPAEYAQRYPDLYAMSKDGTRVSPDPQEHPPKWQVCLTHPMAVELAVDYAREQFDKGANAIGLGMNDNWNWCQCEPCKALYDEKNSDQWIGHGDRNARYWITYINQVAEPLREEFPDKKICYLGYSGTLGLPDRMHIESNLMPFLVHKAMDNGEGGEGGLVDIGRWEPPVKPWSRLEAFNAIIKRFGENSGGFCLYDWYFGKNRKAAPNMSFPAVRHYLRYAHANGCQGVYVECYPNWGVDGHKYYFYFKMLWDVNYDDVKGREEFYRDFFGPAAEPMRRYFDRCESLTVVNGAGLNTIAPYTPKKVAELRGDLSEAKQLAGDDALVQRRIRYFAEAIEVTGILGAQWDAAEKTKALIDAGAPLAEVAEALAAASGPQFDLDLYYKWVLDQNPPEPMGPTQAIPRPDRNKLLEQFPRPKASRNKPYENALTALAAYATTAAQEHAAAEGNSEAEARRQLREQVASKLDDPIAAARVLAQISP